MTGSEFKRWLSGRGAVFLEGTRHTRVYLNGRQSVMPRHPSKEIHEGVRQAILRQLGLK